MPRRDGEAALLSSADRIPPPVSISRFSADPQPIAIHSSQTRPLVTHLTLLNPGGTPPNHKGVILFCNPPPVSRRLMSDVGGVHTEASCRPWLSVVASNDPEDDVDNDGVAARSGRRGSDAAAFGPPGDDGAVPAAVDSIVSDASGHEDDDAFLSTLKVTASTSEFMLQSQMRYFRAVQDEGVVLEVKSKNELDLVPENRQGNAQMYGSESLRARAAIKQSPAMRSLMLDLWTLLPTRPPAPPLPIPMDTAPNSSLAKTPPTPTALQEDVPRDQRVLTRNMYFAFCGRLVRRLVPDCKPDECLASMNSEWMVDAHGHHHEMTFDEFRNCMFQLVDLWCPSLNPDDYIAFGKDVLVTNARKLVGKDPDEPFRLSSIFKTLRKKEEKELAKQRLFGVSKQAERRRSNLSSSIMDGPPAALASSSSRRSSRVPTPPPDTTAAPPHPMVPPAGRSPHVTGDRFERLAQPRKDYHDYSHESHFSVDIAGHDASLSSPVLGALSPAHAAQQEPHQAAPSPLLVAKTLLASGVPHVAPHHNPPPSHRGVTPPPTQHSDGGTRPFVGVVAAPLPLADPLTAHGGPPLAARGPAAQQVVYDGVPMKATEPSAAAPLRSPRQSPGQSPRHAALALGAASSDSSPESYVAFLYCVVDKSHGDPSADEIASSIQRHVTEHADRAQHLPWDALFGASPLAPFFSRIRHVEHAIQQVVVEKAASASGASSDPAVAWTTLWDGASVAAPQGTGGLPSSLHGHATPPPSHATGGGAVHTLVVRVIDAPLYQRAATDEDEDVLRSLTAGTSSVLATANIKTRTGGSAAHPDATKMGGLTASASSTFRRPCDDNSFMMCLGRKLDPTVGSRLHAAFLADVGSPQTARVPLSFDLPVNDTAAIRALDRFIQTAQLEAASRAAAAAPTTQITSAVVHSQSSSTSSHHAGGVSPRAHHAHGPAAVDHVSGAPPAASTPPDAPSSVMQSLPWDDERDPLLRTVAPQADQEASESGVAHPHESEHDPAAEHDAAVCLSDPPQASHPLANAAADVPPAATVNAEKQETNAAVPPPPSHDRYQRTGASGDLAAQGFAPSHRVVMGRKLTTCKVPRPPPDERRPKARDNPSLIVRFPLLPTASAAVETQLTRAHLSKSARHSPTNRSLMPLPQVAPRDLAGTTSSAPSNFGVEASRYPHPGGAGAFGGLSSSPAGAATGAGLMMVCSDHFAAAVATAEATQTQMAAAAGYTHHNHDVLTTVGDGGTTSGRPRGGTTFGAPVMGRPKARERPWATGPTTVASLGPVAAFGLLESVVATRRGGGPETGRLQSSLAEGLRTGAIDPPLFGDGALSARRPPITALLNAAAIRKEARSPPGSSAWDADLPLHAVDAAVRKRRDVMGAALAVTTDGPTTATLSLPMIGRAPPPHISATTGMSISGGTSAHQQPLHVPLRLPPSMLHRSRPAMSFAVPGTTSFEEFVAKQHRVLATTRGQGGEEAAAAATTTQAQLPEDAAGSMNSAHAYLLPKSVNGGHSSKRTGAQPLLGQFAFSRCPPTH